MTWEDMDIGQCACGEERRLFKPELPENGTPICSRCATKRSKRDNPVVELSRHQRRRLEFGRLGLCTDCGKRPRGTAKGRPSRRCNQCTAARAEYNRLRYGVAS